jgi:hypothetical protein
MLKKYIFIFLFGLSCFVSAQRNASARYEIDAKREGVDYGDKDALPRSREFIRLDSTYYVGWLIEGLYKYNRSSDYIGYKQAIVPLQKAFDLLEKDYGDNLKSMYANFNTYVQYQSRFNDLYELTNTLRMCYNNIEEPDETMKLIDRIDAFHFQRDFFSLDSDRAWLYHRQRFFTSADYPFLKNSIEENVNMAFTCCYRQLETISKNKSLNDYWFGPGQSDEDVLTVYHYLAILHNYRRNYDSAQYYYQNLVQGRRVSWSNYANAQHEWGLFKESIENYKKVQYRTRFSLVESDYYLPTLQVYGGFTKEAITTTQQKIALAGSTPGFGWYNIALARAYLYDGQLDSSEFFLNKAFQFKELHIGTTLTQSQYEFTINLLKVQLIDKKIELVKFYNSGWWYSPSDLYDFFMLKSEKSMLEYALVNALVNNPERKRLIYDLFCGEATVSYDETAYLLKDYCLPYFKKLYERYTVEDPRLRITKYFQLLKARFTLEDGDEEDAAQMAENILQETVLRPENEAVSADKENEKLYIYRLLEIIGQTKNDEEQKVIALKCFDIYPQLLPFSGMKVPMQIQFNGLEGDDGLKKIKEELEDVNIEQVKDTGVPRAMIEVEKKGDLYHLVINVLNAEGKPLVSNGELVFKSTEGIGKELALRLLGKGGAVKWEAEAKKSGV